MWIREGVQIFKYSGPAHTNVERLAGHDLNTGSNMMIPTLRSFTLGNFKPMLWDKHTLWTRAVLLIGIYLPYWCQHTVWVSKGRCKYLYDFSVYLPTGFSLPGELVWNHSCPLGSSTLCTCGSLGLCLWPIHRIQALLPKPLGQHFWPWTGGLSAECRHCCQSPLSKHFVRAKVGIWLLFKTSGAGTFGGPESWSPCYIKALPPKLLARALCIHCSRDIPFYYFDVWWSRPLGRYC